MSEWKTITAEEFCDSVRDGTHDTPKQVESGYKLVTAKHINDGQIDLLDAYLISEADYLKINERSKVEQWDVLMSMIGNGLGKSAVVKDRPQYAIKNLALFKIGDEIKAKWLHYYLSSKAGQGFIYNSLQGSGQPFISLSLLRKFPILVPVEENTMQDIVVILSRYDSLIENYQNQIKLLEEAARRLYKEWFVDLRFPDHENTKIVDGIPEGWEKKKISEVGTVVTGKTPLTVKKENYGGNIPFITIPDMHSGIYPVCSQKLSEIGANSQYKKFIPQDSLMVSCIGTAGLVCISKERCQTNQQINSIVLTDKNMLYYMFFTLRLLKEHLNNIGSNGATMTNVNKSKFEGIEVIIPQTYLICKFYQFAENEFTEIKNLSSQIRILTEARDRLLPKLMSGEIEV